MKNKGIKELKKEYMETQVPKELDFVVRRSLKEAMKDIKKKSIYRRTYATAASIAVSVAILTAGVNISPAFADTMSRIPVIGSVVKVLTFKEYIVNEDNYNANIKVPSIEGLENKELESSLNEKYMAENKALYEEFMVGMKEMEKNEGGHLGVDSGYIIKTDTDKLLSVGRYVVNTVGSSSTTMKYDTIDKENEVLITLPSLFKDISYVDIISENIKEQMIGQNQADEFKMYWVDGIEQNGNIDGFDKISEDQNFYINIDGKLVISFDKYEVAPGYMGVVEFVIPTDIISDVLVSNDYVK